VNGCSTLRLRINSYLGEAPPGTVELFVCFLFTFGPGVLHCVGVVPVVANRASPSYGRQPNLRNVAFSLRSRFQSICMEKSLAFGLNWNTSSSRPTYAVIPNSPYAFEILSSK
jgi:hypothetical protein